MGLLDDIRAVGASKRGPCSVVTMMATLPDEDAKDLAAALADRSITHQAITDVLLARGIDTEYQRIARHRSGRCSCGHL